MTQTTLKPQGMDTTTRLASKAIEINRNMTTASGDVAYTGVGFTPTSILMIGFIEATSTFSIGIVDSSKVTASIFPHSSANMGGANNKLYLQVNANDYQGANVKTFDADGFTLTWTKTGSPTGTATLYILCFR